MRPYCGKWSFQTFSSCIIKIRCLQLWTITLKLFLFLSSARTLLCRLSHIQSPVLASHPDEILMHISLPVFPLDVSPPVTLCHTSWRSSLCNREWHRIMCHVKYIRHFKTSQTWRISDKKKESLNPNKSYKNPHGIWYLYLSFNGVSDFRLMWKLVHSYGCNVKAVTVINFLRVLFWNIRLNIVCFGDFSPFFFFMNIDNGSTVEPKHISIFWYWLSVKWQWSRIFFDFHITLASWLPWFFHLWYCVAPGHAQWWGLVYRAALESCSEPPKGFNLNSCKGMKVKAHVMCYQVTRIGQEPPTKSSSLFLLGNLSPECTNISNDVN